MAGPIRIAILANGAQAKKEIGQVNTALGGLGRLAKRGAAAAGIGGLAYGITSFAKGAVQAEAKFSTTMRLIAAATKAPRSEMAKLNDLAIKLGADTSFSASEASDAMLELAKAGVDTETIMGGGLAGTLQLAAAGGTELGTATTIAANALNTFNLGGKDMASVAAALAGGANASSASVESLGQALQQVGPGATNAGLSLQETVAALSAFDAAGIKGSDAGTSLKTMLARLVPQTDKAKTAMQDLGLNFVKGNGEFQSLTNISGQLRDKLGRLAPAQRQVALNTIFGSDASRAATVLMKEGETGIRGFIKATNDQNAAQEMANARMGGTAGAMERLSGSIETAQLRLGQELAPAIERGADLLGDNLVPAMEAGIDAGKAFGEAVAPAVKAIAEALGDLLPSAKGTSDVFHDRFIPAVRVLSDIVAGAVGVIDKIPGPIKDIGIQAGIAALVMPRFTGAITSATTAVGFKIAKLQQLRAEMTYTATRTQILQNAMARLGGAARTAAGIGGMVALTSASGQANEALGILGKIGGGALLGFSVGGPVGAAIGGSAGALWALVDAAKGANEQVQITARTGVMELAASLDQVTGAATKATRAQILQAAQSEGVLSLATRMGINTRDLIGAVLGQEGATRRLTNAQRENFNQLDGSQQADFNNWLRQNTNAFRDQAATVRANHRATQTWNQALRGLPPKVRTEVKQIGAEISARQLNRLKRQYDLTPKQVRTIVNAVGTELSIKKVKGVYRVMEAGKNVKPNLGPFTQFFMSGMNKVAGEANKGTGKISKNIKDGTGKARANLDPLRSDILGQLSRMQGSARSAGQSVGSDIGAGINAGIVSWTGNIAASAANAVNNAERSARSAADSHSPSRLFMKVGEDMGEGVVVGLLGKKSRIDRAGRELVGSAFGGARNGYAPGVRAFDSYADRTVSAARRSGRGGGSAMPERLILETDLGPLVARVVRGEQAADRDFDGWMSRG